MMVKGQRFFATLGTALLASLLATVPAGANDPSIEEQIKALEAEVSKIEPLKDQIERLRSQQIEMKKEATSAAAALPTFEYRPGQGLTISAADKSWAFRTSYRMHLFNYNTLDGKSNFSDGGDQVNSGATYGELVPRRNRLNWTFCWSDCFVEVDLAIDGEQAPRNANFRDHEITFHFEQWNPYLPYFSAGLRRGAGRSHIGRSSDNDGKMEHSIILDGFSWGGAGSHAGLGLGWDEIDVGPSKYSLFVNLATSRQGTYSEFVNDDRKGLMTFFGVQPFANVKNKWVQGFEVGLGYQAHSQDRPENFDNEIRVRNVERRGRFELFRPEGVAGADQNHGSGWSWVAIPGLKWRVGPYQFRAVYVKTQYEGKDDGYHGIEGRGWTLDNQIFIWSPKGLFTGTQTTPNSIMLSWGFERADMNCGIGCDASPEAGEFHSNTVLNRETALWWFIRPRLAIGMWHHWWTTANTPVRTQVASGCKDNITDATAGKGASRECDFYSLNTGLKFRW